MSERPVQRTVEAALASDGAVLEVQSFDALFRRYAPYVGAIALRILGREAEVDDVVQDVFLDAYRGIRELRDTGAIRAWLSRITVRVATRRLKRRRLWAWVQRTDAPEYEHVADRSVNPETRALVARVYRALDALPSEERVAWTLRHLSGEELEHIATLTGTSLATVKRRIARASAALRDQGIGAEAREPDERGGAHG